MLQNIVMFIQNALLADVDFAVIGRIFLFTLFAFCITSLGFVLATLMACGKEAEVIEIKVDRAWSSDK